VLIGFSWRGGEERKGDGLQFRLRVGVSGRGAAIAVPYRLQCTTAATWAASFQQDSQEPTATLSLSDSESDTAHTHAHFSPRAPLSCSSCDSSLLIALVVTPRLSSVLPLAARPRRAPSCDSPVVLFARPPSRVAAVIDRQPCFARRQLRQPPASSGAEVCCALGWSSHEMLCSQSASLCHRWCGVCLVVVCISLCARMCSSATLTVVRPVCGRVRTGWCRSCLLRIYQADH